MGRPAIPAGVPDAPYIPRADEIPPDALAAHYEALRARLLGLFEPPVLPGFTRVQTAILRALARAPAGMTVTRLGEAIYADDPEGGAGPEAIRAHICMIRQRWPLIRSDPRARPTAYYLDREGKAAVDGLELAARAAHADGREAARLALRTPSRRAAYQPRHRVSSAV